MLTGGYSLTNAYDIFTGSYSINDVIFFALLYVIESLSVEKFDHI